MPNLSFVTDWLAVGGRPTAGDVEALRNFGITHVLDVGWPEEPDPPEITSAFKHLSLSILDDGQPKPASWFAEGAAFAAEAVASGGKVLVHCGHGVNRSPAMAYSILRRAAYTPDRAETLIRQRRRQTATGPTGGWFNVYVKSAEDALAG